MSKRPASCLQGLLAALLSAACLAVPTVADAMLVTARPQAAPADWSCPAATVAAETESLIVEDADGNLYLAEYAGKNPYNGADVYALSPLGLATWDGVKAYISRFIKDDPAFKGDPLFAQWVNGLDSGSYAGVVDIDEGEQDKSKGVIDISDNKIAFSGDLTDQEVAWALVKSHLWKLSSDAMSSMRVSASIGGGTLSYAQAMADAGVSPDEEMTRMLKEGGLAAGETMATIASVGDLAAAKELAGGLLTAGLKTTRSAERGLAVIGPRETYREFARGIGAKFLNVTNKEWSKAKNRRFLYEVVKRGDDVVFAGKFNPAKLDEKSVLAWEIRYLEKHGYRWTADFSRLIKQ